MEVRPRAGTELMIEVPPETVRQGPMEPLPETQRFHRPAAKSEDPAEPTHEETLKDEPTADHPAGPTVAVAQALPFRNPNAPAPAPVGRDNLPRTLPFDPPAELGRPAKPSDAPKPHHSATGTVAMPIWVPPLLTSPPRVATVTIIEKAATRRPLRPRVATMTVIETEEFDPEASRSVLPFQSRPGFLGPERPPKRAATPPATPFEQPDPIEPGDLGGAFMAALARAGNPKKSPQ